jgi:uncharacterized Zn finger protein (UPF0148 family)
MDVICKCGYQGTEFVEYETTKPTKQIVDNSWGYRRVIKTIANEVRTLNWACPKCGKVLVQQRGGLSYNMHEYEDMKRRLWRNSWDNEKYLNDLAKTEQSLKDMNKIVTERHDKELERFQVPTANMKG